MIDLRTDTSSMPTDEMREAMRNAEVGNDAFGEDPSVNRLEAISAERLGKEAALFVASGTMGNLIALLAHAEWGDAVLVGAKTHIALFESAGMARLGGLFPVIIREHEGKLNLTQIEDQLSAVSSLRYRVMTLENTHNAAGGVVLTLEDMRRYAGLARKYELLLHVDGARIFNAAVAQGMEVKELARDADSLMFCLSKGLCAPVGSVLVGDRKFIAKAREIRALLGGQMRQAGVIAAAGIVAIEKMVDRLSADHENARFLADGLAKIEGIVVRTSPPQTNMVFFDVSGLDLNARDFSESLCRYGVYSSPFDDAVIRFITYKDITRSELTRVLEITERGAREVRYECTLRD